MESSSERWLRRYYGAAYETLNPSVVFENSAFAVVRLSGIMSKGSNSVGYVLVNKSGTHAASSYMILKEGIANTEELKKMQEELELTFKSGRS